MREHVQRLRPLRGLGILCGAALLSAHAPNGVAQTTGTVTQQIASVEGGVEAAIDAPWRLEPDFAATPVYPRIPIVVSIHDSSLQSTQGPTVALGVFCEMAVREEGAAMSTDYFKADRLSEIERSDKWPISSAPAANHRLCRRWAGETCGPADLDVGPSAEWHGTLLYSPHTQTAGTDVHLTVQVRVARAGDSCGPAAPIVDNAPFDRLGLRQIYENVPPSYVITNRLSVHLGEAALPRFDDGWVYGDLHYHSQGTDNEGESAYAYRPTLQAMRAMGLDFLFATEHASDSEQITDVNLIYLRNIVPDWVPGPIHDWLEAIIDSIPLHEETRSYAARDMNRQRFTALRALLNDPPGVKVINDHTFPTGANAEVMKAPGAGRAARIFLGGEVDVVPEMSAREKASGNILYGNGASYLWRNCLLDTEILDLIHEHTTSLFCPSPDALGELDPATGRYSVHDIQGLGDDSYYARQHMVYLPLDGTRDDAFVSGDTSQFGGAHEHLSDLVDPSYFNTIVDKGYAFLAHPADGDTGTGITRLGPDLIPYSDVQLRTAFESPSILGLQLWNEDTRLRTTDANSPLLPGFPLQSWDSPPDPGPGPPSTANRSKWLWGKWSGLLPGAYTELYHGLAMWDRMLLWGIRPSQTAGLAWLPAGQPRRVFMAGGSDAHGDWNYRRQGRLFGVSAIVDSAIGKPRNLVHVGPERPETVTDSAQSAYGSVSQSQVTAALASGNFAVTDGPALHIALDANANGVIDEGDVTMGGVSQLPSKGTYVPFVVEWKSTDEFGPLAGIDLYVGATSDTLDTGLMYAPENNGVYGSSLLSAVSPNAYVDAAGGTHRELRDGYMLDPTGGLHISLSAAEATAGRRVVHLRANDFVVGRRRVEQEEPVCTLNSYCNKPGFEDLCEEVCTTPPPAIYHFDNVSLPDRVFVRAFARTVRKAGALCEQSGDQLTTQGGTAQISGQCIERLAFTNPVWMDNTAAPPPPGDFSLACTPTSLRLPAGGRGTGSCAVKSTGGFSKAVTLSCVNLPAGASCSFSPLSVTPAPDGTVNIALILSTGVAASGSYTIRAKGVSGNLLNPSHDTPIALTIDPVGPPPGGTGGPMAVFDAKLKAPVCASAGASCDTGTSLVFSRAAGGGEPNAPNTIGGVCADGATAPTSGRWNAVDRIRISGQAGTRFAAGQTVLVETGVWASSTPSTDAVDFFYAADATRPSWQLIATVVPSVAGGQVLPVKYRLPSGALQAVRVQYRGQGTSDSCATGVSNDRDDLVFAVGGGVTP